MKKLLVISCLLLISGITLNGQKKRLTHDDYDLWRYVRSEQLSDNGRIGTWEIKPAAGAQGNGTLYIHDFLKDTLLCIERGTDAKFFCGENQIVYKILPEYATVRKAKIDKVSKDKMPKAETVVLETGSLKTLTVSNADVVATAKEAPVMAYRYKHTPKNEDSTKKAKAVDLLIVLDVAKGDTVFRVENADKFIVGHNGEVAYNIKEDSTGSVWVWKQGTEAKKLGEHAKGGKVGQLVADNEAGRRFAYTIMPDSTDVQYRLFDVEFATFVQREVKFKDERVTFSDLDPVRYSQNGGVLYFSVAAPPEKLRKDTIPDDEKFVLDVWNYKDTLLQSQQYVQAEKVRKNTFQAMYDLNKGYSRRLTDNYFQTAFPVTDRDDSPCMVIYDYSKYIWDRAWSGSYAKDIYLYYPETDARELALEAQKDICSMSPAAEWLVYYDMGDSTWYSYNRRNKTAKAIDGLSGVNFYNELHDRPGEPRAYGMGGWIKVREKNRKEKEYALLYDRYDIWLADPSNAVKAYRLTQGRDNMSTYRIVRTDTDAEYRNSGNVILLSVFNNQDKSSGFASVAVGKNGMPSAIPASLIYGNNFYTFSCKSKNADRIFWRCENFNEFPDMHVSTIGFEKSEKLTDANPQMYDYMWGSVELIRWRDSGGNTVEGLVYYPEDYDKSKPYPTMVYFYERHSDDLHKHKQPYPSRSIICPTMFTSNDYVVFVPDINFRVGYPGPSALEVVVSGSQELIRRGIADPERIGLQGQSWGGYQINYIVTQTDMFRCASPGAGVSDMVSGYATTRDDSGTSRMVQYESGQSRIGATLWDATDLYILNSPVFFLPNVNTPLLLRHSNNDDAVPFQQSMEMFNGLRRLGKKVWLLNYNGEFHNLTTRAACKDWAIRMTQFFDHYLKDAPMPRWMTEGINLRERGKDLKLDYDK